MTQRGPAEEAGFCLRGYHEAGFLDSSSRGRYVWSSRTSELTGSNCTNPYQSEAFFFLVLASAQLEEYSQRYDQDEEMAQCVPEFVYTPVETKPKVTEAKHRPRMKFTPKRRSPEKAPRRKIKPSKNSVSVTPQCPHVRSKSVSSRL